MSPTENQTGARLTCTNEGCGCRLRIEEPCPHGDTYTCACGHRFRLDDESGLPPDLPA